MSPAPDVTLANDLGAWMRRGARRLAGHDRRERAGQFVAWVGKTLAGPGASRDERRVATWVDGLDAEAQGALADQVQVFLADFDLDLGWLIADELTDWPALATTLRALVSHYCLACQAAVDSTDDAGRFRRRRLWQRQRKEPSAPTQPDAD